MCGAVTSQKYRLCGNEREKSRSHLILRESRGWSSRFQPFVGRADERRFCCVTVVLPLMSILKTQCYKGSRKKIGTALTKTMVLLKPLLRTWLCFFSWQYTAVQGLSPPGSWGMKPEITV